MKVVYARINNAAGSPILTGEATGPLIVLKDHRGTVVASVVLADLLGFCAELAADPDSAKKPRITQ